MFLKAGTLSLHLQLTSGVAQDLELLSINSDVKELDWDSVFLTNFFEATGELLESGLLETTGPKGSAG